MDNKSTHGLKPDQLAHLLSISVDGTDSVDMISDDEAIGGLLRYQLATALPKDLFLLESVLIVKSRLIGDIRSLSGKSLIDVFLDPESDIDLLRTIKGYCKSLSATLVSETEIAVAVTIYYAAIASSLLHHSKRITRYSYEILSHSFALLAKKKWTAPELVELFSRAHNICEVKQGERNDQEQKGQVE